jgi:hypothetical protein
MTTSVPECHVNGMWEGVGRASGGFWLVSPFPPPPFGMAFGILKLSPLESLLYSSTFTVKIWITQSPPLYRLVHVFNCTSWLALATLGRKPPAEWRRGGGVQLYMLEHVPTIDDHSMYPMISMAELLRWSFWNIMGKIWTPEMGFRCRVGLVEKGHVFSYWLNAANSVWFYPHLGKCEVKRGPHRCSQIQVLVGKYSLKVPTTYTVAVTMTMTNAITSSQWWWRMPSQVANDDEEYHHK